MLSQTDSGSDNESKDTHAFNWCLIHFGVINKLIWLRLQPHHSHNIADRANSMVKAVMMPKGGGGAGIKTPSEMEAVVNKALESQKGM